MLSAALGLEECEAHDLLDGLGEPLQVLKRRGDPDDVPGVPDRHGMSILHMGYTKQVLMRDGGSTKTRTRWPRRIGPFGVSTVTPLVDNCCGTKAGSPKAPWRSNNERRPDRVARRSWVGNAVSVPGPEQASIGRRVHNGDGARVSNAAPPQNRESHRAIASTTASGASHSASRTDPEPPVREEPRTAAR